MDAVQPMLIIATLLAASGLCLGLAAAMLLRGAGYRPAQRRLELRVTRRRVHDDGLCTLVLQRPWIMRVIPLPAFLGGQSVEVSLPGSPLHRRYSLARWQARAYRYELAVKREESGKFSRLLADQGKRGARICVSPPSGDFVLPNGPAARRAVMIAGGVGITPLLAMIDQWQVQGAPYSEVHLYWQVRHESEWIYRDVLERHARGNGRLRLNFLASRPRRDVPNRISVDRLEQDLNGFADTVFFLCAGKALLESMAAGLARMGVAPEAIRYERFGPAPREENARSAGNEWTVTVEGQSIRFSGHASLLDALEDGGVSVASDCRSGDCGRCRLAVLSGQVRHFVQPAFVLPPGQVLACCATPSSDISISTRTHADCSLIEA